MISKQRRCLLCLILLFASAEFCVAESVIVDFPLDDAPLGDFEGGRTLSTNSDVLTLFDINIQNDLGAGELSIRIPATLAARDFLGERRFTVQDPNGFNGVIRWTFSREIERIQFGYYDQRGDDDGDVLIHGFDEFGTQVIEVVDNYGVNAGKLSPIIDAQGVEYFTLQSTGLNTNSLGWSIAMIEVNTIPEPNSAALLIAMSAAFAMRKRSMRK